MADFSKQDILTALIAGLGLVPAALSALSAARSSKSANEAQRALVDAERREMCRRAAELCADIEREHRRVEYLGRSVTRLARHLAVFSQANGTRRKLKQQEAEGFLLEAERLAKGARELLAQPNAFNQLTSEDAERICLARTLERARLQAIAEIMSLESASLEEQFLQHQAAALAKPIGGQ